MEQFKATDDWYKKMAKLEEGHDISAGNQGVEQPTKTEVIDMKATLVRDGLEGLTRQEIHELINAYLALVEEVNCIVQRFVRGEYKACLVCGKREACLESPDACTFDPTPMELMQQNKQLEADNEALRARLGNNILEA